MNPQDIALITDEESPDYLDLLIENGDFVINNATNQHQLLLLLAHKGHIKEYPVAGVGIRDYLLNEGLEGLRKEILNQFKKDGMRIDILELKQDGKLEIQAPYK